MQLEVFPLTMTIRGLSPAVAQHLVSQMRPSDNTVTIDGAPCKEYTVKSSAARTDRYWLDPARDYVIRRIRRMEKQRGGQLVQQVDVAYRPHNACGWVPASWVHRHYTPAGAAGRTTTVEVLDLRLNEPQPAELFDLRFPPGTTFYDARAGKAYRVQPDGSIGEDPIRPRTELPVAVVPPREPWYRRNKWLLIGLGAMLAALGLRHALQRWRASASHQQAE
jgi:hypothetical protein